MDWTDLQNLTQRGSTSKLQKEDFQMEKINTLGFWGEALYGLKELSDEIIITSKR